jgi:supervillin
LINPIKTSVSEQGSYLLVTAKKMIIRNGKEANVQERSKIARLALQIIAGKEMFEYSGKPELANEEGLAEASFWRNLNGADEEKENSLSVDEYQKIYSKSFAIYRIEESGKAIEMQCEVVSASVLDSTQILVLDFGSEIYIWSGRRSNRSLAKFATEFVEKLVRCFLQEN